VGKYYVRSGQIERVVAAADPQEAAFRVARQELHRWRETLLLGDTMSVSEQGFDHPNDATQLATGELLTETGLVDELGLYLGVPIWDARDESDNDSRLSLRIFDLDRCDFDNEGQVRELTTWGASGRGRTVHVWQVEGEPLCIDVYPFETETYASTGGTKPELELEVDQPMPDESVLRALVLGPVPLRPAGE
jgi:hypothetical protein